MVIDWQRARLARPLALVLAIASTGCLGVNPEYVLPVADHNLPSNDVGTGESATTTSAEAPVSPSSDPLQDPPSGVPHSPSTSRPSPTVTTGSTSATLATSTESPSLTDTSSTATSSTSQSSSSSSSSFSSSSSSTTSDPIGNQDGTWRPIRLALDAGGSSAENGYSAQLHFNHAELIAQGAAAGGEDLAIVYVHNGQLRSIDRVLDPESSWGTSNTKIWFPLQDSLSPGAQVDTQYYLAVGSTRVTVQEDPNKVFLMYDNFDGGALDLTKWSEHTVGSANGRDSRSFGITIHASSLTAETQARSIRSMWGARPEGVMAEARLRFPKDLNQSCNQLRPMAFENNSNQVLVGMGIQSGSWQRLTQSQSQTPLSSIHVDQAWSRYSLAWQDTTMQAWKGSQQAFQRSSAGDSVPRPNNTDLRFRIYTSAAAGSCLGNASSDIDIDWVWIRHYANPEPSATLLP